MASWWARDDDGKKNIPRAPRCSKGGKISESSQNVYTACILNICLECALWPQFPSRRTVALRSPRLRLHRYRFRGMCASWLLCPWSHSWSSERRKTNEHGLGIRTSHQKHQCPCWGSHSHVLWHNVPIFCQSPLAHWPQSASRGPLPRRFENWWWNWSIPCPWTQRRMFISMGSILYSRGGNCWWWSLGNTVVCLEYDISLYPNCHIGTSGGDIGRPYGRLKFQKDGKHK